MSVLHVDLDARSYPIFIGAGYLGVKECFAPYLKTPRAAIVTNETVAPLYMDALTATLAAAGVEVLPIVLPDGEAYKNWEATDRIYEALLRAKCGRDITLIALGGGVIGDLTGFAAATYMRGVGFIQVPTTLLAQVDSSVGGKTGFNHALGKNMIGAFYQPRAVVADLATLETLPARELPAGLAEVVKYGAIVDPVFFAWCDDQMTALRACSRDALEYAVRRSCEIKADVVGQDERESGVRALLNFGHTFGHAIEAGLGYGAWLHGEAVGAGMVMASRLSERLGYLSADDAAKIEALVAKTGLPVKAPQLGAARFMELMSVDKKAEGGRVRYVVLRAIGNAVVEAIPDQIVYDALVALGQAR